MKGDLWGLGCIFAELFYSNGLPLFQSPSQQDQPYAYFYILGIPDFDDVLWYLSESEHERLSNVLVRDSDKCELPILKRIMEELSEKQCQVLTSLLEFNPTSRIPCERLLEFPFFRSFIDDNFSENVNKPVQFNHHQHILSDCGVSYSDPHRALQSDADEVDQGQIGSGGAGWWHSELSDARDSSFEDALPRNKIVKKGKRKLSSPSSSLVFVQQEDFQPNKIPRSSFESSSSVNKGILLTQAAVTQKQAKQAMLRQTGIPQRAYSQQQQKSSDEGEEENEVEDKCVDFQSKKLHYSSQNLLKQKSREESAKTTSYSTKFDNSESILKETKTLVEQHSEKFRQYNKQIQMVVKKEESDTTFQPTQLVSLKITFEKLANLQLPYSDGILICRIELPFLVDNQPIELSEQLHFDPNLAKAPRRILDITANSIEFILAREEERIALIQAPIRFELLNSAFEFYSHAYLDLSILFLSASLFIKQKASPLIWEHPLTMWCHLIHPEDDTRSYGKIKVISELINKQNKQISTSQITEQNLNQPKGDFDSIKLKKTDKKTIELTNEHTKEVDFPHQSSRRTVKNHEVTQNQPKCQDDHISLSNDLRKIILNSL